MQSGIPDDAECRKKLGNTHKDPLAASEGFGVADSGLHPGLSPSVSHLSPLTLARLLSRGVTPPLISTSLWPLKAVSESWLAGDTKWYSPLFLNFLYSQLFHSMFFSLSQFCTLPSSNGFLCFIYCACHEWRSLHFFPSVWERCPVRSITSVLPNHQALFRVGLSPGFRYYTSKGLLALPLGCSAISSNPSPVYLRLNLPLHP